MAETDTSELVNVIIESVPLIARAMHGHARRTNPQLPPPHFALLRMLCAGPMSQSELAGRHWVSASTMSATIETLVKRGWVRRRRSAHDRRVVVIAITPQGQAVVDEMVRNSRLQLEAILAAASAEQRQTLLAAMRILRSLFLEAVRQDAGPAESLGCAAGVPSSPPTTHPTETSDEDVMHRGDTSAGTDAQSD